MAERRRVPFGRVDPARAAAYEVLTAVREQDAYSNLVLPRVLARRGLMDRDAAFATELTSGTLRRQGTYDAILATLMNRPLEKVDAAVLDALRLGTHQLLGMRVPPHAAVGTTVDLVRGAVGHKPAGFVNAVLRKVGQRGLDAWVRRVAPDPGSDPVGYASVAYSHPRWVVAALTEALGPHAEEIDDLLAADNVPPKVTLVARPGLCERDELVASGGEPSDMSPHAVTLPGGDPGAIPAVASGRAGVQDEGSQLVALALARAEVDGRDGPEGRDGRDGRWLDTCAGPGGKAALLAALAGTRSARLLAGEKQPHRAELVRRAAGAVGVGLMGPVVADGTRPPWRGAAFDRAIVDAPCSGLGALRRRPEARWRKTEDDLTGLVRLQTSLLHGALDAVRPGGVVAYVTCSPVIAETSGVVTEVLAARDDVRLEDAVPLFPDVPDLRAQSMALPGTVQLWPHRQGTDAMFFALLRRH